MGQIFDWLYRESWLFKGTLAIGNKRIGPASLRLPLLAAVNPADEIAPPQSVTPFVEAEGQPGLRLIQYPGETGVSPQHLAFLTGRQSHERIWPEVLAWVRE